MSSGFILTGVVFLESTPDVLRRTGVITAGCVALKDIDVKHRRGGEI